MCTDHYDNTVRIWFEQKVRQERMFLKLRAAFKIEPCVENGENWKAKVFKWFYENGW